MARVTYIFHPGTGLYYPLVGVGDADDVAPALDSTGGVPTPPPYVPEAGEPLVTLADYEAITGLTVTNTEQWTWLALAVSEFIEFACHRSWRTLELAVPVGLQVLCAKAISAYTSYIASTRGPLQAESFTSYSYTIAPGSDAAQALAPIKDELKKYTYCTLGC